MLDAFPNEDRVRDSNLRQFATAVAGLLHISDFQRRRITHMMRHYRDMRRRLISAALPTGFTHMHLVMQFATPSLWSSDPAMQSKRCEIIDCTTARLLLLSLCLCCSSHGHIRPVGCDCRRSSHLANTVVQQFKHAVATGTHRLSDTSGPPPDLNGSLGSNTSLEAGSPADSTSSAPQLGANSPRLADHVVVNMDSEDSAR